MPRVRLALPLAACLGLALGMAVPPLVCAQSLGDPSSPPAAHGMEQYWGGDRPVSAPRTAPRPVAVTPDATPSRPREVVPERPVPAPTPRTIPPPSPTPTPSPRVTPTPPPAPVANPRAADPEMARINEEIRRLMRAGDSDAARRLASEREQRIREQQRLQRERAEQIRQCRAARTC